MKKLLVNTIIIFLAFALNLNAQEKKVHIKMVKNDDGKVIEMDTIIEGHDFEGMHIYTTNDFKKFKMDSMLKELHVAHSDSMKHFWVSIDENDCDSLKIKKKVIIKSSDAHSGMHKKGDMMFISDGEHISDTIISKDGKKIIIKSSDAHVGMHKKGDMIFISEGGHGVDTIISEDGMEIIIKKHKDLDKHGKESEMHFWVSDSDDFETISEDGTHTYTIKKSKSKGDSEENIDVFVTYGATMKSGDHKSYEVIVKTGDGVENLDKKNVTYEVIATTDDKDHGESVSEVFITKKDAGSKYIEVIIDEDEADSKEKIIELKKGLENAGENVKITKYKTDDGKIVIKAEISGDDCAKEDKKELEKLGLVDKIELEVKKININYDKANGIFSIEFEIDEKETTLIKVYDKKGEEVFSEKIKKFKGSYTGDIDLSKEAEGAYYLKISQGEKSYTEKVLKK